MHLPNSKKIILVLTILFGLAIPLVLLGCVKKSDLFSDDAVVAQFANGVLTTDQITAYVNSIVPKCHTPAMECHAGLASSGCASDESCDTHDGGMAQTQNASAQMAGMGCCGDQHGGEHAGCCGGSESAFETQACGEHLNCCIQHYDFKEEDYRNLIDAMVLEQMLQEYIRENNIGQEEDTQNLIKYVTQNVYIRDTHLEMEESMRPAELEIRNYYEEYKEQFGLKTINEVRDDIEKTLKNKMHREYMPKYLAELTRNAFIRKNLELLEPSEPSESELNIYYLEHRNEYQEPEKVKVRQILTHTRQRAEQAQSRLRVGANFVAVAEEYSEGPFADSGGEIPAYIQRGERSDIFEENVFGLREDDTSNLFEDDGSFYIVQVIERSDQRIRSFWEVADSIREALLLQKEEQLFEENALRTLFTVNNQSYSVEDFKRRYDSLPVYSRVQFRGLSGKEKLIDRMIEYELLVDDAQHKMFDLKNKETVRDITDSILEGTLYEQEIIGRIAIKDISDEEALEYYNENMKDFTTPPKAQISYIRIPIVNAGGTEESASGINAAKQMADEAYSLLLDGAAFEDVARGYSADEWSARKLETYEEKGREQTYAAEDELHPLHKVVFGMKDGEISKPVQLMNSFFIFKLWEKSEEGYVAFDRVKDSIKQLLVIQKRKEIAETLKNELMKKSQLVVNNRALKLMVKNEGRKS